MDFINKVLEVFGLKSEKLKITPCKEGHINNTFKVGEDYILQKINTSVFTNPVEVMDNIAKVTDFLKEKIDSHGGDAERETLTFLKTSSGEYLYKDDEGGMWRLCKFIKDSVCLQIPENENDFFQSGVAFGRFLNDLADFKADTLFEVIKDFHDTEKRFLCFEKAVEKDPVSRVQSCKKEIDFLFCKKAFTAILKERNLPIRVTHNDAKLNNVLLTKEEHKALCVIDLDTVMAGYCVNDFGDSIRFGASTANEDERDLNLVSLSLDMFKVYSKGYLSQCKDTLTQAEIDSLVDGAMLMTLESAIRFLTDYILGDTYFKTEYPEHNLVRAKTQIKLFCDMEKKHEQMQKIIKEIISA